MREKIAIAVQASLNFILRKFLEIVLNKGISESQNGRIVIIKVMPDGTLTAHAVVCRPPVQNRTRDLLIAIVIYLLFHDGIPFMMDLIALLLQRISVM